MLHCLYILLSLCIIARSCNGLHCLAMFAHVCTRALYVALCSARSVLLEERCCTVSPAQYMVEMTKKYPPKHLTWFSTVGCVSSLCCRNNPRRQWYMMKWSGNRLVKIASCLRGVNITSAKALPWCESVPVTFPAWVALPCAALNPKQWLRLANDS